MKRGSVTNVVLVDGKSFLLVVKSRAEVTHARLSAGDQVVRDGNLEAARAKEADVQGEGLLEEAERQVVLANGVEYEPNVAVEEGHLGVVLPVDDEGQVAGSVQQAERRADLGVGEAVERHVGLENKNQAITYTVTTEF